MRWMYLPIALLNFLFWAPAGFELTPHWYYTGFLHIDNVAIRAVFAVLPYIPVGLFFMVPFIMAFLLGVYQGKQSWWRTALCGFTGAVGYGAVSVWDMNNGVAGGCAEYGSSLGIAVEIFGLAFITGVLSFFGGKVKEAYATKRQSPPL